MSTGDIVALNSSKEREASTASGYPMLLLLLVLIGLTIYGGMRIVDREAGVLTAFLVIGGPIIFLFVACGFYMLQPNQAAAITSVSYTHLTLPTIYSV